MLQTSEKLVSTEAERYLLVYVISAMMIITVMVITFFVVFQRRKTKLLRDKFEQQRAFEEELAKTQLEIQEQTLKNVGRELHDNVGQMLAYTSVQLSALSTTVTDTVKAKVTDVQSVIKDSIEEVRALSKSLNSDVSLQIGLVKSLQNEISRINNLKTLNAKLEITGNQQKISNQNDEIFIYRIIQEFLSNALKYSEAKQILVSLTYDEDLITINVQDNGKGFDFNSIQKGSGLINMKNRAKLINADFNIDSTVGEGTTMSLKYAINA